MSTLSTGSAAPQARPCLLPHAGNHYTEIQVVDQIYDSAAAAVMGITEPGQASSS